VISYLQDFLFSPDRARQPAGSLSGGERNRLLLARLFAQPANVLVLDEPTNDLDVETLELLEALVVDFPGTVLLVSHDRAFLDNAVSGVLAFEGEGVVREYVGGYADWLRQRPALKADGAEVPTASAPPRERPRSAPRKLSYKEQRELEVLPGRIEALESEQSELHQRMGDPAFFRQQGAAIAEAQARLTELESALTSAYARWEALEAERDRLA
jgi:ATP-binding cassette subfamily F protein uup